MQIVIGAEYASIRQRADMWHTLRLHNETTGQCKLESGNYPGVFRWVTEGELRADFVLRALRRPPT